MLDYDFEICCITNTKKEVSSCVCGREGTTDEPGGSQLEKVWEWESVT